MRSVCVGLLLLCVGCGDDPFTVDAVGALQITPRAIEFRLDGVPLGERTTRRVELLTATGAVEVQRVFVRDTSALGSGLPAVFEIVDDPTPIEVGQDPTVLTVGFTRLDDEPRRAQLVVVEVDGTEHQVPIVALRGNSWLATLPAQVVFSGVGVGETPSQAVRVLNTGAGPVSIDRITFASDGAFGAAVGGTELNDGVVALSPPLRIEGGEEAALDVLFAPEIARPYRGSLTLWGDGPNTENGYVLPLLGNDEGPCLLVNPSRVVFGAKPSNNTSPRGPTRKTRRKAISSRGVFAVR